MKSSVNQKEKKPQFSNILYNPTHFLGVSDLTGSTVLTTVKLLSSSILTIIPFTVLELYPLENVQNVKNKSKKIWNTNIHCFDDDAFLHLLMSYSSWKCENKDSFHLTQTVFLYVLTTDNAEWFCLSINVEYIKIIGFIQKMTDSFNTNYDFYEYSF